MSGKMNGLHYSLKNNYNQIYCWKIDVCSLPTLSTNRSSWPVKNDDDLSGSIFLQGVNMNREFIYSKCHTPCDGRKPCFNTCCNKGMVSTAELGTFGIFYIFFNNKNDFWAFLYQVKNLFLHQSYLKSPLPVKLT